MQSIRKFNKEFRFLLCVTDVYNKYAWLVHLKDKKGITITNAFKNILHESNRKPNKIWVDKGREFYNRSVKSWLQDNDIEIYSTHNGGKSAVEGNSLFGAIKLTRNADFDKYKYPGFGIGFDAHESF